VFEIAQTVMPKTQYSMIAMGSCVILATIVLIHFVTSKYVSLNQRSREVSDDLSRILEALALSSSAAGSTSNQQPWSKTLRARQHAIDELLADSNTYLPQLMEEIYSVGRIDVSNRNAIASKSEKLGLAFEVLGSRARPLLPQIAEEFTAGRSMAPCAIALMYIGGTDCGLLLVSGLTNSDRVVRNTSMSALSGFAGNRDVALAAVDPLLLLLKDDDEFSRALASTVLGSLQQKPADVIPELLQVAKHDVDLVVRTSALKAIGRFGTNAAMAMADLGVIAATDPEPIVRRTATVAIRAASGEIPSDEVQ